nr:RNA-directed DNA polymerase, eukaryota [Tanacetum cinerariifolium]
METMKHLHDVQSLSNRDNIQKAKVRWAVEGDENTKFFDATINKKRANLSVKGIMVDGDWVDDPSRVKDEFRNHFAARFQDPGTSKGSINFSFPNRLTLEQVSDLESVISRDEIFLAMWGCSEDKSPGPGGFTFEFFRKFWAVVRPDFCIAVEWFFEHWSFAVGCNSSFVALIMKILDPKVVSDYRPISLIGSLYKVVTKILATRLSSIISVLISDVQTAFLQNRQILDGPSIINEILSQCKFKNQQAMVFNVDFVKAYDYIRWDYLDDVLSSFGFGPKWRSWIRGSLNSGKASILVNGSPTSEFQFYQGLKQGDPLAPFLFIPIMGSLHLSFSPVVEAGIFTGIRIGSSLTISHLFYTDDAVFISEWSHNNLKAAMSLGCSIIKTPFKYLGILVGGNMSLIKAWDVTINKLKKRLSKWKLKTLSIEGRLTLPKSVLSSTPIYNMSLFKVPKSVLYSMESLRQNFFNGIQEGDRKIVWVKWSKVLAPKNHGGLGVSSFYSLNRALFFKWVWRFLSQDNSLWFRVIAAIHGSSSQVIFASYPSTWNSIINEVNSLKTQGVDLLSHYLSKLDLLLGLLGSVLLSNMGDRRVWDLNRDGVFRVKDVRNLLDETFLPKSEMPTRWLKCILIKVNVFVWKAFLDRLPTHLNLARRNVVAASLSCLVCDATPEDTSHLFFQLQCGKRSSGVSLSLVGLRDAFFQFEDPWLPKNPETSPEVTGSEKGVPLGVPYGPLFFVPTLKHSGVITVIPSDVDLDVVPTKK